MSLYHKDQKDEENVFLISDSDTVWTAQIWSLIFHNFVAYNWDYDEMDHDEFMISHNFIFLLSKNGLLLFLQEYSCNW